MAKSIFALNRALTLDELVVRRRGLVRLGLAWLAMMQVGMFALPGYLDVKVGPDDSAEVYHWAIFLMNWASFVMTVPVVLYSAWPVWTGFAQAVHERRVTMDVPVAISIVAAFVPSAVATIAGHGEVYFDSVTMFIAFLLTARYFEIRARQAVDVRERRHGLDELCDPLIRHADRVATVFVLVQLAIALVVASIWWVIDPEHAMPVTVSLLVMSCPCALSLAAPASLAAAHATLAAFPHLRASQKQALFDATRRVARQNLNGALAWHVLTMPLAAVGLVTPWVAALAMLVSSGAVICNAWRLYREPDDADPAGADAQPGAA